MTDEDAAALERAAADLAAAGGARIRAALAEGFEIDDKSGGDEERIANPVTAIDRAVEAMLRAEIARRFPDHAVIGEEDAVAGPEDAAIAWALDPIDGTVNFVNALPLYACSIGVLAHGRPVAGAVWCAATPALGPGTYHGRAGGGLFLDGVRVERSGRASRCPVAGAPGGRTGEGLAARMTGSSAIELAFVAAGAMAASLSRRTAVWDVAGGLALVAAAGGLMVEEGADWSPFRSFADGEDASPAAIARWCGTVIGAGDEAAALRLAMAQA
ncbi:MAG: inositol monophosphatase family protein [Paracoccaceae bacterium]